MRTKGCTPTEAAAASLEERQDANRKMTEATLVGLHTVLSVACGGEFHQLIMCFVDLDSLMPGLTLLQTNCMRTTPWWRSQETTCLTPRGGAGSRTKQSLEGLPKPSSLWRRPLAAARPPRACLSPTSFVSSDWGGGLLSSLAARRQPLSSCRGQHGARDVASTLGIPAPCQRQSCVGGRTLGSLCNEVPGLAHSVSC